MTAPAATARQAAMIRKRQTTRATGTVGTMFLICSRQLLAYSPPNRLHTSAARLTALFRLIHRVSVRIAPSNPSTPMAARLIQPIVCWEVGAGRAHRDLPTAADRSRVAGRTRAEGVADRSCRGPVGRRSQVRRAPGDRRVGVPTAGGGRAEVVAPRHRNRRWIVVRGTGLQPGVASLTSRAAR